MRTRAVAFVFQMKPKNLSPSREFFVFLSGVVLILAYWILVKPLNPGPGYFEDFCIEMSRRAMSDSIERFGKPTFVTDLFMAPFGMPVPFFSWSIERDWMGAWFWKWNKFFPFIWAYFLASLFLTYAALGYIFKKMKLSASWAWAIAALICVFNIPRHFKIWYHIEYLAQHWLVISIFLDAWIWAKWTRERKWSWILELWRAFLILAVLGTPGYFWAMSALVWMILRLSMLLSLRKPQGMSLQIEGSWRAAILPSVLCLLWLSFELRWFIPLITEMRKLGTVSQGLGWWANIGYVFRPLWLDILAGPLAFSHILAPLDRPETVVTAGWFYWVPAVTALVLLRKKAGGSGLKTVFPFVLLLVLTIAYFASEPIFKQVRWLIHWPMQHLVPFMSFFRATSRWGIVLPYFLGAIIILSWPELSAWAKALYKRRPKMVNAVVAVFALSSIAEAAWLFHPVMMQPPLASSMVSLLDQVRAKPGTTVLDMPFCVAGGNGVCTAEQCPNYPLSTVSGCLSSWHDKKIYGLYQARLAPEQCQYYGKAPFTHWFSAWKEQRCLSDDEWQEFCTYLEGQPDISSILIYPDIWKAAGHPACRAEIEQRLGAPLAESVFLARPTRGGAGSDPSRIWLFPGKCSTQAR